MSSSSQTTPLISVVMGVHNEKDEYLRMALDSICNQTYKKIEVIIVDDCSNEGCKHTLSEYAKSFDFIRIIHNKTNLGLTKSLNIGIHQSFGAFIARMDADDYSVPTRIEKQVAFMTCNPDIDICGTGVVSFGDEVEYMSPFRGISNGEAQSYLFFSSTLCHPSVLIRKSFLDEHHLLYDENVKRGQDYDLWERSSIYGKLAVLKEVLLFYRLHAAQITSSHRDEQNFSADRIRLRRLSRIGISPSDKEYECHMLLGGAVNLSHSVQDVRLWIDNLITANASKGLVDNDVFAKDLRNRFVLFKLRNHHYVALVRICDIICLIKILFDRLLMKQSLKREINKFQNLIENV